MLCMSSPSPCSGFEFALRWPWDDCVPCSEGEKMWSSQRRHAKQVASIWELESIKWFPIEHNPGPSKACLCDLAPCPSTNQIAHAAYIQVCAPGHLELFAVPGDDKLIFG